MATIIGGNDTGILNSSLTILNRGDATGNADSSHGDSVLVNASNGNLIVQQTDAYLPSQGEDSLLLRTYNSRGLFDPSQGTGGRWSLSTFVNLEELSADGETYYQIRRGDGSLFLYRLNPTTGLYESTDGAGAFETLEDLGKAKPGEAAFRLTRADQTVMEFDKNGRIIRSVDTNGNEMTYRYQSARLVEVTDDTGHVLSYHFEIVVGTDGEENTNLVRITDEDQGTLVEYRYEDHRLTEVIDRMGHSTRYFYTDDGYLNRIELPQAQMVNGVLEQWGPRVIEFEYTDVQWPGSSSKTLTKIIGPERGETTFDYALQIGSKSEPEPEEPVKGKKKDQTDPSEDKFFHGGTTRVVDALGNARAYSNLQEYQDWRILNGFYAEYDSSLGEGDAGYEAQRSQAEAIRDEHSVHYVYNQRGYLTEVVDQQSYHTIYQYDDQENLIALTDRNGWGVTQSDSDYYRALRAELGYTVPGGSGAGKSVAQLSETEIEALLEAYTSHFEYDASGNLTQQTDNEDNVTTFTYTAFNKVETSTSAMGHALAERDEPFYKDKRVELGYARDVGSLSDEDKGALRALYATHYEYDENQNLIRQTDPGGDITLYEYDAFGNLTRSIVLLDPSAEADPDDPDNADKVQISTFDYDPFGNVSRSVNGEGDVETYEYDHFGNLLKAIDGNGGVTQFTYDADNRLLTVLDPEGHLTTNAYDAVGNLVRVSDATGHTITRIFDRNDRLITVIDPSESTADSIRTRFTYDVIGNNTQVVDAEERETTFVFDARRQLVASITPEVAGEDGATPIRYRGTFAYDGAGNLVRSTDNRGSATEVVYDQNGLVLEEVDPLGHRTRYEYNANLNAVQITVGSQLADEARRQVLRFRFDGEDQLIREVDSEGGVTSYAYDAPGTVHSITDPNGHALATSDDAFFQDKREELGYERSVANLNDLDKAALLERHTRYFSYDGANRLVRETTPQVEVTDPVTGNTTIERYSIETNYDDNGNVISTTNENGQTTTYRFDRDNRMVMVEDANQVKTVFEYDSRDNATKVLIGTDADWDEINRRVTYDNGDVDKAQVTTNVYDEFNRLTAVIDGVGNALAGSDDPLYRDMRRDLGYTDASGEGRLVADLTELERQGLRALNTTHFSYDSVGNLKSRTDNSGNTTSFDYDGLDRLVTETGPVIDVFDPSTGQISSESPVTTRRYDGNGNLVAETDAKERTTHFSYDKLDRLETLTDPLGVSLNTTYDAFGNVETETVAFGTSEARTTSYEYDLNNRLKLQTDPLQHTVAYEYDAVGNRVKLTDGREKSTSFVHDALDRNIKVIDPMSFETKFEYDGVGNVLSLIDTHEGITRFDYDPGNRQIRLEDAEGRVTKFAYDALGNAITRTTAVDTTGAGSRGEETTTFVYDAENNLRSVTDAKGGVTTYGYDRVYNQASVADGRGNSTVTEFDALNRVVLITDGKGNQTKYRYDVVGNLLQQEDARGNITEYDYYEDDRLFVQRDAKGIETHLAYDKAGNQTRITRAAGTADEAITRFSYDLDDRLTAEEMIDVGGNTISKTTYHYDANDNLVEVVDANGHALVTSNQQLYRDMRAASQFASDVDDLSPTDEIALLDSRTTHYEYDDNNRVFRITDPEGNDVEYRYDGNGNRVQVIDGRGFATTTYYNRNDEVELIVDAEGYATEFEYDDNGNVIKRILYMTQLADFVGDPVFRLDPSVRPQIVEDIDADQVTEFFHDELNRLVRQVSPLGFERHFEYDAVGNLTESRQELDLAGTEVAVTRSYFNELNQEISRLTPERFLITFEYDEAGNLRREVAYRQKVSVPSQAGELPIPVAGDAGAIREYTYDANNRLKTETQFQFQEHAARANALTSYEYDARGNRRSITEGVGTDEERKTEFEYDGADRLTDTIAPPDEDGNRTITHLVLDADGNIVERHDVYNKPSEARITTYGYDRNGAVNREEILYGDRTPFEGSVVRYDYDAAGNLEEKEIAVGRPEARSERFEYDRNNRLKTQINGMGERTEFEYDGAGNRTRVLEATGDDEARENLFGYSRDNRLTTVTDAKKFDTVYAYDGTGNRLSSTQTVDATGGGTVQRVATYRYDLENRLREVTSPGQAATIHEYDAFGNRVATTDANGNVTQRTFDAWGRLISELSPENVLVICEYDVHGNLLRKSTGFADSSGTSIASDIRTVSYRYDEKGQQTHVTDGEGFTTRYTYDVFGYETKVERGLYLPELDPGATQAQQADKAARAFRVTTSTEYDLANRTVSVTQGEGSDAIETRFGYNGAGNLITETIVFDDAADSQITRYDYDNANRLIRTTDPEGGITELFYRKNTDWVEERRILKEGDPRVSAIWINETFKYDENGNEIEFVDGGKVKRVRAYDKLGNMISETTAADTVRRTLGAGGRVVVQLDNGEHENARTTSFEYNLDNYLVAEVDPMQNRTEYTIDSLGNRVKETDALGRDTHSYFDGNNRLVAVLDPERYLRTYLYDSSGNQILDRLWMERYSGVIDDYVPPSFSFGSPDDRPLLSFYDRADNLSSELHADGLFVRYTHNGANLTIREERDGFLDGTRTETSTYYSNGRLKQFFEADGETVTTFHYDEAGNKVREERGTTTFATRHQVKAYEYDRNNRLKAEIIDPGPETIPGTNEPWHLNIVRRLEYDKIGNVVKTIDPNNAVTEFTYDQRKLLLTETVDAGAGGLNLKTIHGYDTARNRLNTTDPRGNTTNYEYDLNDRLRKEILPSVEVHYLSQTGVSFARPTTETKYDAVGNVEQVIDPNGNKVTKYYNGNDQEIAVIRGDNTLIQIAYNAAGEAVQGKLYMNRVSADAHNPAESPNLPGGEVRTTDREYDLGGRLVRVIHPEIDVTSLNLADLANATTNQSYRPQEVLVYNLFGELVETYDRNAIGMQSATDPINLDNIAHPHNRHISYYDSLGRIVASLNAEGYLTEFVYDGLDNVVQQTKFKDRLNMADVSASQRPVRTANPFYDEISSASYDKAGRLTSKSSPFFHAIRLNEQDLDNSQTFLTQGYEFYEYDKAGNRTLRGVSDGTQAYVEHFYYDAANRLGAFVDDQNVLHRFGYDKNGNQTSRRRYFDALGNEFDYNRLVASSVSDLLAGVTPDPLNDQLTSQLFDAANRLAYTADEMSLSTHGDDLTQRFWYDQVGNRTKSIDEDGYESEHDYDGLNRAKRTVMPDGTAHAFNYDAAGNLTRRTTGRPDSVGVISGGDVFESTYNALNYKTGSNEGDGVWRTFGLDANGNSVATFRHGTQVAQQSGATPITIYAEYDNRNFEVSSHKVVPHPITAQPTLATTATIRDFKDRAAVVTGPLGRRTVEIFNALGLVTSRLEWGPNSTFYSQEDMYYDALGNLVKTVDGNGNARFKSYDGYRLIKEFEPYGTLPGSYDYTQYEYDSFGRLHRTTTPEIQTELGADWERGVKTVDYDQRDRVTRTTDALAFETLFEYDGRNNRTQTQDAEGRQVRVAYDGMNRPSLYLHYFQTSWIGERREYDPSNGNLVREEKGFYNFGSDTITFGSSRSYTYEGFGRLKSETDEGGRTTVYKNDVFGRPEEKTRGRSTITINILGYGDRVVETLPLKVTYEYDIAGRLSKVSDQSSGLFGSARTSTEYTYDLSGNTRNEVVAIDNDGAGGDDPVEQSNVTYSYDALDRLIFWEDSVQDVSFTQLFDAAGNIKARIGGGDAANYGRVDYSYDRANQLTSEGHPGTFGTIYLYDGAGNRIARFGASDDGQPWTNYTYYLNGRVKTTARSSDIVSGTTVMSWEYDKVGNVKRFTDPDGTTEYRYHQNNQQYYINDSGAQTETTLYIDGRTGRVTGMDVVDSSGADVVSTAYGYYYTPDGREIAVRGTSGADTGISLSIYDADDNLKFLDLDSVDAESVTERKAFYHNNDGQVIRRQSIAGDGTDTRFLYANGNPVGQKENGSDVAAIFRGRYDLVQPIGESNPEESVNLYRVVGGDTLRVIADRLYGNPSLWFVIAEANGLTGTEPLSSGMVLQIPNTVLSGRITDETHVVYDAGEIVGSTLPNLSAPVEDESCSTAQILLIVLIVAITLIVIIATAGVAAIAAAAVAAGTVSAVAAAAAVIIVGAALTAASEAAIQALEVEFGVREEIDPAEIGKEVAIGTAIDIATLGLGKAFKAAKGAKRAADTAEAIADSSRNSVRVSSRTSRIASNNVPTQRSIAQTPPAPRRAGSGEVPASNPYGVLPNLDGPYGVLPSARGQYEAADSALRGFSSRGQYDSADSVLRGFTTRGGAVSGSVSDVGLPPFGGVRPHQALDLAFASRDVDRAFRPGTRRFAPIGFAGESFADAARPRPGRYSVRGGRLPFDGDVPLSEQRLAFELERQPFRFAPPGKLLAPVRGPVRPIHKPTLDVPPQIPVFGPTTPIEVVRGRVYDSTALLAQRDARAFLQAGQPRSAESLRAAGYISPDDFFRPANFDSRKAESLRAAGTDVLEVNASRGSVTQRGAESLRAAGYAVPEGTVQTVGPRTNRLSLQGPLQRAPFEFAPRIGGEGQYARLSLIPPNGAARSLNGPYGVLPAPRGQYESADSALRGFTSRARYDSPESALRGFTTRGQYDSPDSALRGFSTRGQSTSSDAVTEASAIAARDIAQEAGRGFVNYFARKAIKGVISASLSTSVGGYVLGFDRFERTQDARLPFGVPDSLVEEYEERGKDRAVTIQISD